MRRFLSPRRCPFEINDFTLCYWPAIIALKERAEPLHATHGASSILLSAIGLAFSRRLTSGSMLRPVRHIMSAI